jgi:hypothetical protein
MAFQRSPLEANHEALDDANYRKLTASKPLASNLALQRFLQLRGRCGMLIKARSLCGFIHSN